MTTHLGLPNIKSRNIKQGRLSMSANYMCASANANDRLANQDLTPRWLNLSIRSGGSNTN